MEWVIIVIFGIIGGIIGGMGMGGGTILIPLLTIFLSISQKFAQGYNLYAFLFMAVFALIIHWKNKMIDFKSIAIIVLFGIGFCVIGAYLTKVIETQILKYFFAGFLILLGIWEFSKIFYKKN